METRINIVTKRTNTTTIRRRDTTNITTKKMNMIRAREIGEGEENDKYDDSENDKLDQEGLDHDSFDNGLELIYHAERKLDCVDIALRKTKLAGLIAVIGYKCQGKRTARVKRHKDLNNK
ncbi:hypothetical protein N7467_003086 [Penicillium canescens]|nr:hypothetical protein N7467_003086 [Penicillium canescens]